MQEHEDEDFINKMNKYARESRKMAFQGRIYTPPGSQCRGITLPTSNKRPSDIILYGVSCRELSSKDGFERFTKWLCSEVFPAINP